MYGRFLVNWSGINSAGSLCGAKGQYFAHGRISGILDSCYNTVVFIVFWLADGVIIAKG